MYDALNNYELAVIKADEASLAKASASFKEIRDAAVAVPEGALSGQYSTDCKISVEKYLKKLRSVQIKGEEVLESTGQNGAENKNGASQS